jgi:type IV pilus assembly protein PilM
MILDKLKSILQETPPAMAFEISEAGIAAARVVARPELEFMPLPPGVLSVSPLKENVIDQDAFAEAVRRVAAGQNGRKPKDVAVILPDFCARIAVLDFDGFPADVKEQDALIRFRLKRAVPFDVESAALSYWAQTSSQKHIDVVVVVASLEIVSRYEAPFRAAGMNPGLLTTSSLAALELAPEAGLSVLAKLTGRVLTVLVRDKASLKLVRCLEMPSNDFEDIAAVLAPTLVFVEDNFGRRAEHLQVCGFPAGARLEEELGIPAEELRSAVGAPGENNAGLLGYLRSVSRSN